jgi:hypothetical protein
MKFPGKSITGMITSRNCPTCGHHEIGLTTEEGDFYALRPGTWVQVIGTDPEKEASTSQMETFHETALDKVEDVSEGIPWAPDYARNFRSLSLKYGVILPANQDTVQMDSEIFEKAYLQKLRSLIEKEKEKPLAVILDQFFAAPHLASGNPGEIALNMWNELEEIREPVERIRQFLEGPEGDSTGMDAPGEGEKPYERALKDTELSDELENLSLEEFLSLF